MTIMMIRRRKAGLRAGPLALRAPGDAVLRPLTGTLSGAELRRVVAEMVD